MNSFIASGTNVVGSMPSNAYQLPYKESNTGQELDGLNARVSEVSSNLSDLQKPFLKGEMVTASNTTKSVRIPSTGWYLCFANANPTTATGVCVVKIMINGTQYAQGTSVGANGSYSSASTQIILSLTENMNVDFVFVNNTTDSGFSNYGIVRLSDYESA